MFHLTCIYNFHSIGRFIGDLCVINDRNSFVDNFKDIYLKELELKLEHQSSHAPFLDLDIGIKDGAFVYKLFDKRDAFSFEIVRMSFIDSNIPSNIFYGAIFSEILRIIRCTLKFEHLKPRLKSLFRRMIKQGATKYFIFKQINKGFLRYPEELLAQSNIFIQKISPITSRITYSDFSLYCPYFLLFLNVHQYFMYKSYQTPK